MTGLPFFKIIVDFSCNHEYEIFDEKVGRYWDNLYAAKMAIEKMGPKRRALFVLVWRGPRS